MTRPLLAGLATLHTSRSSAPFWEAARRHVLVAQQCDECETFRMPPAAFCWRCRSAADRWVELPGTGTVFTHTTITYATAPEVDPSDLPYTVLVVDLDDAPGCRLIANLLGPIPDGELIGTRMQVRWDDVAGVTLPRFEVVL